MSSYWERRQAEDMFHYMEEAEAAADQVAALYRKTSRYLSLQADQIFDRYKTKHGLSEVEARQLINTLHDQTSINDLLQRLRNGDKTENKQELLKQLEAPAYQARLERLRQLQNQIDLIMQNVYQQEKDFSTSFYTDLAREAYYRNIFNIQQRAEAAFSFAHVSQKQIDLVLNSRWSGENYSKRIWKNTQALAKDIKEELLINLVTGRTNREAARIIANKFAQGSSNARRLIRTESNFLSCELNFKAYEECGVEEYQYLAILDLRTSKVCRELDGKIFQVKDRKVGTNCPPMHPWCRSTTISVIDRALIAKMKRSAIDPATGKRIKVPRSMNYQEWYDKYVNGTSRTPQKSNAKPIAKTADAGIMKIRELYEGIPSNWEKLGVPDATLKAVNPRYNLTDKRYNTNCANCVSAFEMRRRGYDVIAKPMGKNHYLMRHPEDAWKEPKIEKTIGNGLEEILKSFEKWPDKSRAEVAVTWKYGDIGHVFVAEKIDRTVHFYDVQSGTAYSKSIFKRVKEGETKFWRIDNLEPSDRGITACEVGDQR